MNGLIGGIVVGLFFVFADYMTKMVMMEVDVKEVEIYCYRIEEVLNV